MATDNLADKIPDFNSSAGPQGGGPVDVTAIASIRRAKGLKEILSVLALAVVVVTLLEFILIWSHTEAYVFPKPTSIIRSLFTDFPTLYLKPLRQTVQTFFLGLIIGSTVGLSLAVLVTLKPGLDIFISPYIIILVTTPMVAVVVAAAAAVAAAVEAEIENDVSSRRTTKKSKSN